MNLTKGQTKGYEKKSRMVKKLSAKNKRDKKANKNGKNSLFFYRCYSLLLIKCLLDTTKRAIYNPSIFYSIFYVLNYT